MNRMLKIKVIGIGGSGSNAISRMMKNRIEGVELIAINTDRQDLKKARAHQKVQIGKIATRGLGTGMNPLLGKRAAEEDREKINNLLQGTDLLFIVCGLGGGTGTGAAPVVAEIARELEILTVAIVTLPFSFEGRERRKIARSGEENLKNKVDTLISVSNDKLATLIEPGISINSAFWIGDETLRQAVTGISNLITLPGIINIDFADIKMILKNSGKAIFGIGIGLGENRVKEAVKAALSSPLTDLSCHRAKKVLFNVSGDSEINLVEIDEIAKEIKERISPDAKIIFGAAQSENLKKKEVKVTIIATGF